MNQSLANTTSVTGCLPLYREWCLHFLNNDSCQQPCKSVYKHREWYLVYLHLLELSMADDRPKTLEQYCQHFNTSFFNLHLPCIFCSSILTYQDLAAFTFKNLNLVYRNSQCYACCTNCCCLSARFEFEKHCKCSVRAVNIETVSGKHLHELVVRCHNCLHCLDIAEKYDTICRDDYFYLVRNQWKAYCRKCVPK